jgi:hypothetical protein
MNYLPKLASNHDPPNVILPNSWSYRREPRVPSCRHPFLLYFGLAFAQAGLNLDAPILHFLL